MKLYCLLIFCLIALKVSAQEIKASWISPTTETKTTPNSWYCYRKDFDLKDIPESIVAKIATDTKYWLWINGKLVVYEGGLKRGPNPQDTYYDEVDIATHLKKGKNCIAVLVWFWGGKGFSHNNSGQSALLFDCAKGNIYLNSNSTWKAIRYNAYTFSTLPKPNFRLSEPNISYNAQQEIQDWQSLLFNDFKWATAIELGKVPMQPWNQLVKRYIPLFKFSQLRNYSKKGWQGDTLTCTLPYNGQFSSWLEVTAKAGEKIFISSDTYFLGAYPGDTLHTLCTEYTTKKGKQQYESLLWLSGHEIRYVIPKGVKVNSVQYRETGYASKLAGSFHCSDTLLNTLWQKAQRTLYVNMRDNYMDCPDRERAQWAGDAASEMAQAFYALDRNSDQLSKKLFLDLFNWQRKDSVIYNPVPETDWKFELPTHSLMPLSELWRYYMFTKDTATVALVYPALKKYLAKWTIQASGQLVYRPGGWDWGDWGDNKDFVLIQHGWYLLATQTAAKSAVLLDIPEDEKLFTKHIALLKQFLNSSDCWNGKVYRYKDYKDSTDDRANALMLMGGVADSTKYASLTEMFIKQLHASPWMEKLVLESLIKMNKPEMALTRMKLRYKEMIQSPLTTLWEIWEHNEGEVHGNSGYNHGWAGGPLVLLSQYYAGITPDGEKRNAWIIKPMPAGLQKIAIKVPVTEGILQLYLQQDVHQLTMKIAIPAGVTARIAVPKYGYKLNQLKHNGKPVNKIASLRFMKEDEQYYWFDSAAGEYNFEAKF